MLTLNTLAERLATFSAEFRNKNPRQKRSSIALYQGLFGFLHNLKSSIQLSEDSGIQALLEMVLECETCLRKLAQDEMELAPDRNAALHMLASNLDSLEALHLFLKTAEATAIKTYPGTLSIFSAEYSWESLSRARATSVQRHGYIFFFKELTLKLSELTQYDESVSFELISMDSIDIARNLQPKPNAGNDLFLEIRHLIAIPREVTNQSSFQRTPS